MGGVGKNPRPDNTQFFRAIMQPLPPTGPPPRPVIIPEVSQVAPCRYCRSPRDGGRTTCDTCGAPYPALTL